MILKVNHAPGFKLPRLNLGGVLKGPFQLVPGENEVPDDYWAKARGLSGVVRWMAAGLLSELEGLVGSQVEPDDFSAMTAKEAIAAVSVSQDAEQLKAWLRVESLSKGRKTVTDALTARLTELSGED